MEGGEERGWERSMEDLLGLAGCEGRAVWWADGAVVASRLAHAPMATASGCLTQR